MSNIIKKTLEFGSFGYYKKHLELINPVLPVQMTNKEIEVLAAFMNLKGEIAEQDRFGTTCRKIVKQTLNLSNGGLANYLRLLREKGFINETENGSYNILMFLFPQENQQQYEFKIINNGQTSTDS